MSRCWHFTFNESFLLAFSLNVFQYLEKILCQILGLVQLNPVIYQLWASAQLSYCRPVLSGIVFQRIVSKFTAYIHWTMLQTPVHFCHSLVTFVATRGPNLLFVEHDLCSGWGGGGLGIHHRSACDQTLRVLTALVLPGSQPFLVFAWNRNVGWFHVLCQGSYLLRVSHQYTTV